VAAVPQRLDAALERRVLGFWADALDVEAAALDADGTVVVQDPRAHARSRRGTIRTPRGTVVLVAPGDAAVDPDALAIATLLEEREGVVDVGVLVTPAHRRKGLATTVVRDVARRAVSDGMLVQYRCQPQNKGSAAVARACCGFALWGVLAVAPLPGS
jgi:RimJ/RimL family protein N-acetyltransferase